VEGTVREVKRRVRVVANSYRAIDRSVTRWIVVTMMEWSSEVRWEFGCKMGMLRAGVVFCRRLCVRLSAQNLENNASEIDVT